MLLTQLELTKFLWSWFDFRKTQGIPLLRAKHEPSQNSHTHLTPFKDGIP